MTTALLLILAGLLLVLVWIQRQCHARLIAMRDLLREIRDDIVR